RLTLGRADRTSVLAAVEAEAADAAPVDLAHRGGRRSAPMPEDGRGGGHPLLGSTAPRIRVALWPPNPNEFESTGARSTGRGRPATTSSPMSSPIWSRLAVGGMSSSRSEH